MCDWGLRFFPVICCLLFTGITNCFYSLHLQSLLCLTFNNYFYLFLYLYITWGCKVCLYKLNIFAFFTIFTLSVTETDKSRKENPQKLTQLSSRSHPRHLVGKRTAQKDTIIDITSDSQVNFPYRWSPASLTFNNYFYLFLYLYIT